jgi:TatD DNase family protein
LRENNVEGITMAKEAGVELVLTAGIDMASSEEAVNTARKFDIVKGCVGIHPWYADEYSHENLERLRKLAVSEIGLDFAGRMTREWVRSSEVVDHDVQRKALRAQIGLARELGLPVLVHDRAPGEEMLDILEEEEIVEVGAAIHGFDKGLAYAKRATELGVYLSIGRGLLRGENEELEEAVQHTPMEWLLTETDSSDPIGVIAVAQRIAEIKGLTTEEVGQAATRNLKKLLHL